MLEPLPRLPSLHIIITAVLLSIFSLLIQTTDSLTVSARFGQEGITGTIEFSQITPSSPTTISLSLFGLNQLQNEEYPWHIHQYPIAIEQYAESPCSATSVGGHYDPFDAFASPTYAQDCQQTNRSLCEVGDLSGKFGNLPNNANTSLNFIDSYVQLYGQYSIVGRSIVIHFSNGSRYVCANIGFPIQDVEEGYPVFSFTPLRGGMIFGDISIVQYSDNATFVYSRLVNTRQTSPNHNWHVHSNPVMAKDTSCASAAGHYNPRNVDISGNYSMLCSGAAPMQCEVGDLSGKGGTISFNDNLGRNLYTDTDLPYLPLQNSDISIANRSIVVHEINAGPARVACGNIMRANPRQAIATFNGHNGINGVIKFEQDSPFSMTKVEIDLTGLSNSVGEYHIYETPVEEGAMSEKCMSRYTGNRLDAMIGDLSSKFGELSGHDSYKKTFTDTNIPLYGRRSIVGRSIVLQHKNGSSRRACANIVYNMPTVESTTALNISGFTVQFSFVQPANNPYADTTITIKTSRRQLSNNTTTTTSSTTSVTSNSFTISQSMTTSQQQMTTTMSPTISLSMLSSSSFSSFIVTSFTSSTGISASSTIPSPTMSASSANSQMTSSSLIISTATSATVFSDISSSNVVTTSSIAGSSVVTTSFLTASTSVVPSSSIAGSNVAATTSSIPMLFTMTTSTAGTELTSSNVDTMSISSSSSSVQSSATPSPSSDGGSGVMMRRKRGFSDEYEDESVYDDDSLLLFADDDEFQDRQTTDKQHLIHKRETMSIDWSIKRNSGQQIATNCASSLEDFLKPVVDSMSLCASSEQLACSAGALAQKHGMIQLDTEEGIRMVVTDPYLPLSGPDSAVGNFLLISANGDDSAQYVSITNKNDEQQEPVLCTQVEPTTTSSSSIVKETSTSSSSSSTVVIPTKSSETSVLPLPLPIFIAVCAGGVLALGILVILIIVIIVCCCKRRQRYSFDKYMKSKSSGVELGMYKRSNPVYGVSTYKVLYDYKPQAEGDLELKEGEMIMLLEAPAGKDWWRGSVAGGNEGWFPKTYVNYVDVQAEQKKMKEAEIDRVEAVIRAYTLAGNRGSTLNIDSTPKMVTKFDQPVKEENESTFINGYPLPNTPPESSPGTPRLDNNRSPESTTIETATTEIAIESPPSSNESPVNSESPPLPLLSPDSRTPSPKEESPIPTEDIFVAKYDLVPESDSELRLTAGEQVVIIERADNGWWHGVIGEQHGWIPETFLEPLQQEDNKEANNEDENATEETDIKPKGMTEFHSETSEEVNVSEYRALADYVSDTEGDLSFKEGDIVLVYWGNDDGWWFGAAGSAQGYFPGSYLEPVMEETKPLVTDEAGTSQHVSEGSGLSDQIANALKKREAGKKQETNDDEEDQKTSEPQVTMIQPKGDLASEITAALKKKQKSDESEDVRASPILGSTNDTRKDRSDSVERLGSDISTIITNMGSNENLPNAEKTVQRSETVRRPQRKAPPPPSVNRSKSTATTRPATRRPTNQKKTAVKQVTSAPGTIPTPPPPPPLPPVAGANNSTTVVTTTPTNTTQQDSKNENLKRPETPPGSTPSRRRKPPAPPSPLTLPKTTDSRNPSPSPLVVHSMSKSPTPPVVVVVDNETTSKSSPTLATKDQGSLGQDVGSSPNLKKAGQPSDGASVQRAPSTAKWQPQTRHKNNSGWKPQTRKSGSKDTAAAAPRREPPKPPPSSESTSKIKIQKVKRPEKNIPPPPSAPLPPPPSKKTNKRRPPPVKKVLSVPPPVKQVLGGPQPVKKALASPPPTSPLASSPPTSPSALEGAQVKPDTQVSVVKDNATKTPDNDQSKPAIGQETLQQHTVPDQAKGTSIVDDDPQSNTNSNVLATDNVPVKSSNKPAVSPKPRNKPAVSPKPAKVKPAVSPKPNKLRVKHDDQQDKDSSSPQPKDATSEVVLRATKPRPEPPVRTSSLPNTPEGSPSPSPVPMSRSTHPTSPLSSNETQQKKSVPVKPPPPKLTTSTQQVKTITTEATDGVGGSQQDESDKPPVAATRKKSATVPPRPAPPKTTKSPEKSEDEKSSAAPNPTPRKISEVGPKIKNLMSPMKTLEGRPQRNQKDDTPANDNDKPVAKRRSSQQDETTVTAAPPRKSSIPARPPPPTGINSQQKPPKTEEKGDTGSSSSNKDPPVPRPRSTINNTDDTKHSANETLPSE